MKLFFSRLFPALVLGGSLVHGQTNNANYTNFIRQVQLPAISPNTYVTRDVTDVAATSPPGGVDSPLEINPGGARFELHTVMRIAPFTAYVLDSKYVGAYVPIAELSIRSEDDTWSLIPRTRADRPFFVDVKILGLLAGVDDPVASKSVNYLRHVQSYGVNGTGVNLDRSQATLVSQSAIAPDGTAATTVMPDGTRTVTRSFTYPANAIPGSPLTKVRGEERLSVFSLQDTRGTTYSVAPSQLASQYIQIWPVADGSITGITNNQSVRFSVPNLTITANDLYPGSAVWAQVYKGNPRDNTEIGVDAAIVPGSLESMPSSVVPQNRVFAITNWDSVLTSDGRWTLELVTETPFDLVYLQRLSFDLDRTIQVNGSVTTINN